MNCAGYVVLFLAASLLRLLRQANQCGYPTTLPVQGGLGCLGPPSDRPTALKAEGRRFESSRPDQLK
jgi:hypothetical protein